MFLLNGYIRGVKSDSDILLKISLEFAVADLS